MNCRVYKKMFWVLAAVTACGWSARQPEGKSHRCHRPLDRPRGFNKGATH